MSSFFSQASFVMDPSVYRAGTLFVPKPTDGSGDLTITRTGDTATRVGPNGYIEKVRTNLVLQSNMFSAAPWFTSGATLTAGQPDPFGGNNAFLVDFAGATTDAVSQNVSMVSGTPYTLSVWIKGIDLTDLRLTVGANLAIVTSQVINGTWVRISSTQSAGTTGNLINQVRAGNSSGQSFYIYGAQLETGDIATDYIPTTTTAVSVGPVANVPRLNYSEGCPSLLLEPQTTAVTTYSEQIDNAAWGKQNVSVTANNTASPSGYVDADKIVEDTANSTHFVSNNFTASTATSHTFSVFAKMGERKYLCFAGSNVGAFSATYDLEAGTVIGATGATASIENYGNGWYRCVAVKAIASAGGVAVRIGTGTTATVASLGLTQSYLGDGTSGLFIWGVNVTATGYVQSYIPTLASASTRGADAAVRTGASSFIGQTEGTLFAEFDIDSAVNTEGYIARIDDTSFNDTIYIVRSAISATLTMALRSGGSPIASSITTSVSGRNKAAIAYKSGEFAFYLNGTQLGTSTATYTNGITYDDFRIGGFTSSAANMAGVINQALLFKTRLPNSELAKLTSL